jgi:hypothetical protein
VEALLLLDRDATYGTPIEAPSSEAMMSGLEAMFRLKLAALRLAVYAGAIRPQLQKQSRP